MSGGSIDYAYSKVRMIAEQFLEGSDDPLRRAMAIELFEMDDVLEAIDRRRFHDYGEPFEIDAPVNTLEEVCCQ